MAAKRIPQDCKRLTERHVKGLSKAELTDLALRVEVQAQALNRSRRLIASAIDDADE